MIFMEAISACRIWHLAIWPTASSIHPVSKNNLSRLDDHLEPGLKETCKPAWLGPPYPRFCSIASLAAPRPRASSRRV